MGKTPKENMIATLFQNKEMFGGGVIAAANHIASFCREVEVVTALGELDTHEELIRQSLRPNVKLNAITIPGVPTIRKSRIIDKNYFAKLHEVYYMNDEPLSPRLTSVLNQLITSKAKDAGLVIVTDFGHGLINETTRAVLENLDTFLAVNSQTNTANFGYNPITKYQRCDYFCIDAPEARMATRNKYASMREVSSILAGRQPQCGKFIITHGRHGCLIYDQGDMAEIPAFTTRVIDTIGAGDAFLAITSPLVAVGLDMADVGFIGNAVGALKVNIVGHRQSIEPVSLLKFLTTLLK
jgi:sugar/nucleoside kinase (ribokinase family)